jgi:hypothetical protein
MISTEKEEKDKNEKKINEKKINEKKINEKEIEECNKKLIEKYDKLKESYEEEVRKSKQLSEKIKNLEEELIDEKKKNENLTKELEAAKNSTVKGNQNYEESNENKNNYLEIILLKDKEISELKKKLDNCILLSKGEELISIIFIYEEQQIHYSLICKNVDNLAIAEQKLFEKFPEMRDEEYDYYFNKTRLKRAYKFNENNVNNGDIITLKKRE